MKMAIYTFALVMLFVVGCGKDTGKISTENVGAKVAAGNKNTLTQICGWFLSPVECAYRCYSEIYIQNAKRCDPPPPPKDGLI